MMQQASICQLLDFNMLQLRSSRDPAQALDKVQRCSAHVHAGLAEPLHRCHELQRSSHYCNMAIPLELQWHGLQLQDPILYCGCRTFVH